MLMAGSRGERLSWAAACPRLLFAPSKSVRTAMLWVTAPLLKKAQEGKVKSQRANAGRTGFCGDAKRTPREVWERATDGHRQRSPAAAQGSLGFFHKPFSLSPS